MLSLLENINTNNMDLAYKAQEMLGQQLANVACNICDENGVQEIGVVGGSAVNSIVFNQIKTMVKQRKKQFLFYKTIPPGDGGISTGQALVTASKS
jgi:hydrogenase maturation factor HypF (carbamoyltransferase family)